MPDFSALTILLSLVLNVEAAPLSPEPPPATELQMPLIERLCPAVVARWKGQEMKREEFLKLARSEVAILAAGNDARALARAATQLVDEIHQKRAALDCAAGEGLVPDLESGKAEFLRQEALAAPGQFAAELARLGLSREQAIRQGAETACVLEWQALLVTRQSPGEIESRLYYTQNPKLFESAGAIRLGKIVFPYADAASEALAKQACAAAENSLRQGESDFGQACKTYGAVARNVADCGGFVPLEHARKELEPAYKLPAGQVLSVQIPGSWILLRVHASRGPGPRPFEEVDAEIRRGLAAAGGAREARRQSLEALKDGGYRNFLRHPEPALDSRGRALDWRPSP
ncbi:MAG: hypothetical protein RL095_4057 [Verrucomicrobiota bacterium]